MYTRHYRRTLDTAAVDSILLLYTLEIALDTAVVDSILLLYTLEIALDTAVE